MNAGNARLNAMAIAALPDRAGQEILDIGFGGGIGVRLALADVRIAGVAAIDASMQMVRAANARHRRRPPGKPLDVRLGVAEQLPWDNGVFDAALSANSLYYWSDIERAFGEAWRVLRPSGVFVLGLRRKEQIDRIALERYGYRSPSTTELGEALTKAGCFGPVTVQETAARLTGGEVIIAAGRQESPTLGNR